MFEICDTLQKLLKVKVYVIRFFKGRKRENKDLPMNTDALDDALKICLRIAQRDG